MDAYWWAFVGLVGMLTEYLNTYSKGLNAKQTEFAVHKYCSHHKIGAGIFSSVDMPENSK